MAGDATFDLPEDVIAFALDTNALGNGLIDFVAIEKFADSILGQDLDDVEIWIPEPVIWEWAEHTFRQHGVASSILRKMAKELQGARLELTFSVPEQLKTIEDIVAHIRDELDDIWPVQILELSDHPQAATLGLRDQVLGLGAGRRKSEGQSDGVKTGAADSASYRLIDATAGDDVDRVVLVTGDRDAWRHYSRTPEASRPTIVRSLWAARRGILHIPSNEQYAEEVRTAIIRAFGMDSSAIYSQASFENAPNPFEDDSDESNQILSSSVSITSIGNVAEVSDLEVSRGESYASAVVNAQVDFMIEGVRWDDVDDELIHVWDERHGVEAELQISAQKDAGDEWKVEVDHIVVV